MPHLKYNVDASKPLGAYVSGASGLRRQASDLSVGTQRLWPAYREQPLLHRTETLRPGYRLMVSMENDGAQR
jgi:hypothetical protein